MENGREMGFYSKPPTIEWNIGINFVNCPTAGGRDDISKQPNNTLEMPVCWRRLDSSRTRSSNIEWMIYSTAIYKIRHRAGWMDLGEQSLIHIWWAFSNYSLVVFDEKSKTWHQFSFLAKNSLKPIRMNGKFLGRRPARSQALFCSRHYFSRFFFLCFLFNSIENSCRKITYLLIKYSQWETNSLEFEFDHWESNWTTELLNPII